MDQFTAAQKMAAVAEAGKAKGDGSDAKFYSFCI